MEGEEEEGEVEVEGEVEGVVVVVVVVAAALHWRNIFNTLTNAVQHSTKSALPLHAIYKLQTFNSVEYNVWFLASLVPRLPDLFNTRKTGDEASFWSLQAF